MDGNSSVHLLPLPSPVRLNTWLVVVPLRLPPTRLRRLLTMTEGRADLARAVWKFRPAGGTNFVFIHLIRCSNIQCTAIHRSTVLIAHPTWYFLPLPPCQLDIASTAARLFCFGWIVSCWSQVLELSYSSLKLSYHSFALF